MGARAESVAGTRDRIARAAMALFLAEPFEDVTLMAIASAAGVSHQTVLNHCGSKAGVLLAAGALFSERVRDLEADALAGDVVSVVRTTCRRYEVLGDANVRWEAMGARAPEIADGLARGRRSFQSWLHEMLGDLMPGDDEPEEQRRVLLGLHAALDVFSWKLLRRDLGLSREQTERQLTDLALGVLARHRS